MALDRVAFIAQDVDGFDDDSPVVYAVHWEDVHSRADIQEVSREISEEFFGDRRIKLRPELRNEKTRRAVEELERRLKDRNPDLEWCYGETFDSLDDALAWARERAPKVVLRLGLRSQWSAGAEPVEDLPTWPQPAEQETIAALAEELRAFHRPPS